MTNAQQWLDKEYPNKERVKEISDVRKWAERFGSLMVADFPNLEEITFNARYNFDCQVKNCPKLKKMVIAFSEIKSLSFNNCPCLENLIVINSKITSLDLSGLPNLKFFDCTNNEISTSLDISNNLKLECLYVTGKEMDSFNIDIKKLVEKIQIKERQSNVEKLNNLEKKIAGLQIELEREKNKNKFLNEQLEAKIEINNTNTK